MVKKRAFKKLREHLTSIDVDKKIEYLESRMPTNNTALVFQGDPSNPQGNSFETIVDGEENETDYNVGESPSNSTEARDTAGLFNASGNHAAGEYVKTVEPPGDTSYVLGPMAAMYYTWSYPWTMIGYIRESDRRMVNLARIDGKLSDWDQSSGFSSYGQLTLDQAKWFYNIQKANGNSNDPDTYSYRAFYPGPPSQTADAWGRYPCILTGVSKQQPRTLSNVTPLGAQAGDNFSAQQAQADKGSGFISFKPDLDWFKKNNKKPKGAPSDWNNMSDDEKSNWINTNQPEERFNYGDGRFTPDDNNAQSSQQQQQQQPTPDPNANFGTGSDGNFGTGTFGKGMPSNPDFRGPGNNKSTSPNPDDVNAAVGHGLSKERAQSMTQSEIKKFVAQQNALQADINKHSADQKKYEKQARDIAIGYGVDVVTTIFGGPILKGAFKGISLGVKGIKALTTANKVSKVASAIQKTDKISKAAATAKATSLVNKANKVNQSATKTNNAIKAVKTSQKANLAKTTQLPKQPLTYKGPSNVKSGTGIDSRRTYDFPRPTTAKPAPVTTGSGTKPFKPGSLTGKGFDGKPLKVSSQTPTTKPVKPGSLTGKGFDGKPLKVSSQTPVKTTVPKTTGTTNVTTGTGVSKTTSITQKVPKNQIPKKGPDGKFNIDDLNIKDAKGNVTAKVVKNPKTGDWERISRPGKGASGPDLAKWEKLEGQVSNKAWDAYTKTGLLNPSPLGNPLSAMNPFTPQGLRSGPTALAKKFGIPAGIGAGVGAYKGTEAVMDGIQSFNPKDARQFVSNIKGGIESIVSNAPSVEQATNGAIQLASQVLPQDMRTPARMFLGYLSGSIKGNAGDIVPEADQESAWKGMKIGNSSVTVGGPMVNVFGGEPIKNLKVDGDNAVFEFNFAPRSNKEEFDGAGEDRWSPGYKSILTKLEPLTQYAADLSPNFGKTTGDKAVGLAAGATTNIFKQIDKITPDGSKLLGGIKTARDLNGSIKIPLSKLKTLNSDAYDYLTKKGIGESVYISRPYKPSNVSLERKREIFGHLTQPVILPETKQKTYKVSPGQRYKNKNKKPEKTNFQDMDKLFNKNIGGPQPFKPQERTSWTKDFINQNIIKSQEKMNGVLELVGDGKFAFDHAMNDYKKMGAKELEQYWGKNPNMYSFLFNGRKYNVTRKEHIENDSIVFMEDDYGCLLYTSDAADE